MSTELPPENSPVLPPKLRGWFHLGATPAVIIASLVLFILSKESLKFAVALYSITAMLTTYNMRSVIVGTTNRDEGLYLGYIGKASDGMVDLQPISDLHKSQVRLVAKYLDVPQSILDVTPTGDMFDEIGRASCRERVSSPV